VKVLKEGRPQQGWSHEYECTGGGNGDGGCGALLLVSIDDLYKTYSHARDEITTYVTFTCPECDVETDIWSDYTRSKSDFPSDLVQEVDDKKVWNERQREQENC